MTSNGTKVIEDRKSVSFYSKYPVFAYTYQVDDVIYLTWRAYNPDTQTTLMCGPTNKHIAAGLWLHERFENGEKAVSQSSITSGYSFTVLSGQLGPNYSYECSGYIFESEEAGIAYFKYGDKSGIIQWPEPDYDYDHDFLEDVYDPDIPVPELSNLSHNGFHVNNADPTRDIEIYMTSTFYGVKHNSNIAINFDADKSWVFNTHRYNLINTDISYSDADIDILKMFRVDNVKALTEDFKKWSFNYPTHNSLPDCKSFRHQPDEDYNIDYKWYHTYNGNSDKSSDARLHDSKQASTTYLVRFCQYVPGEGYTWGKWVSYTYTPSGYGQKDNVTIGDVEIDPETGDPSITNPQPGKQDPSTGDVDYGNGTVNIDSSDLWATIKSLVNDMGAIPEIIGGVLSFLPSWILYMIAAAIAACVILRFVGR